MRFLVRFGAERTVGDTGGKDGRRKTEDGGLRSRFRIANCGFRIEDRGADFGLRIAEFEFLIADCEFGIEWREWELLFI